MSAISQYASLTTLASGDELVIVDIDDMSMSSNGTTKKVTAAGLLSVDWLNVVTMYGADPTGIADSTTAINNALAAGAQCVYLPAGTYLLNGSSALSMATSGQVLCGAGYGLTKIKIGASFAGTEAVSVAAGNCTVKDLQVTAASSTISSNPVCNGIEVQPGSLQVTLQNLFFSNVNGYAIEAVNAGGHPDISHAVWDSIMIFNTAGGVHFSGNSSTVGTVITNLQIGNIGTGSGGSANLDSFFIEDAQDVIMTNCGIGVGSAGTGHAIHIKGACSNVWIMNTDCGGFPGTLANSQCGIMIEDSAVPVSPKTLRFIGGVMQTFGIGAQVTGGANAIWFKDMAFENNQAHGVSLTGTGGNILFLGCTWGVSQSNGQVADGGTYYDLNSTGSPGATGFVRDCRFESAVVTAGNPGVQGVVSLPGGTAMNFEHTDFLGASAGLSNIFTNQPNFVRDCRNYNPHGSVTVTMPGSGTASTALHYDAYFYITAATGGTTTLVRNTNGNGGGVGPSVVIPTSQLATVFVRAGTTITPTYGGGNAPTWVVDGN